MTPDGIVTVSDSARARDAGRGYVTRAAHYQPSAAAAASVSELRWAVSSVPLGGAGVSQAGVGTCRQPVCNAAPLRHGCEWERVSLPAAGRASGAAAADPLSSAL